MPDLKVFNPASTTDISSLTKENINPGTKYAGNSKDMLAENECCALNIYPNGDVGVESAVPGGALQFAGILTESLHKFALGDSSFMGYIPVFNYATDEVVAHPPADRYALTKSEFAIVTFLSNLHDIVQSKAYELWEAAGRPDGQADYFWEQAQTQCGAELCALILTNHNNVKAAIERLNAKKNAERPNDVS